MAITRLTLNDFRNHGNVTLRPNGRFIVLHGPNGAGKTNIIEAVSLLVPGRGLRRASLGEMARSSGAGGFSISAELNDDSAIGTGTQGDAPERRKVRINGAPASANSLSEWIAIMWLTPAMDRLFSDGAGNRRRFLDRLVLSLEPAHAAHASRYEKALRQRNRLLGHDDRPDTAWLDAIEREMAMSAAAINAGRNRLVDNLAIVLAEVAEGPFAKPVVGLDARPSEDPGAIHDLLHAGRAKDMAARRTLTGPHRTDFIVHHMRSGQPAARCSTGEQKALLLSILLAHAGLVCQQRGSPPVLLLDEVAAHLDPQRRAALYQRLSDTGCQVWMTGTEASLFDAIGDEAQYIAV